MKLDTEFFFLEQVPNASPLDALYYNVGHLMFRARPELGAVEDGRMVLVYEDNHYDIYIERDSWFKRGEDVLRYSLASDERLGELHQRLTAWVAHIEAMNAHYKDFDWGSLTNEELARELEAIVSFEKRACIEIAEMMASNYGTDLVLTELKRVLKELGFAPTGIAPILLRSTRPFPITEYERAIGELALAAHADGCASLDDRKLTSELSSMIDGILDRYGWLDASLAGSPKSRANVFEDTNSLLAFGDELTGIIMRRDEELTAQRAERERVLAAVLAQASPEQRRVVMFAIEGTEFGRVLVDELMRFIYYRRAMYVEIGKRLRLSETETKFHLTDELKAYLLGARAPDREEIAARRELCAISIHGESTTLFTGNEARRLKEELEPLKMGDDELAGEVAFSNGKVVGTARLIRDASENDRVKDGDILVSSRTYPDLLPAMKRASAIVAELGGLLSHAAIVSRELHIPCVVGVRNATARIKDGDRIEVDTETGSVRILES